MSLTVFLCHSSGDKPAVRELYEALQRDGFDPWLDEESLLPGQDWNYEITKAVRNSDVVLVCLSEGSVNKAGYVQKEIKFALDVADEQPEGTIFIIPVKLDECDVPDRLSHCHWVSLEESKGYERLIAALNSRASNLGMDLNGTDSGEEIIPAILCDEETTIGGDSHSSYSCDLEEGDRINIDMRSDKSVDVLIMDENDYQEWHDKGEVNLLYKEFSDRDQLHAFFTAPDTNTYLVIVRNNSDDEVDIELKISQLE